MCNSQNVDVIIKRFLLVLSNTYDHFQRQQLVDKICELAERHACSVRLIRRFAPEPSWYINTMTQVFAFGGRQVKASMEANLIRLLSESQGDPSMDRELRCLAVNQLYPLVLDPLAPENLIRVATWIFGEYGHLSSDPTLGQLVELMGDIWHRPALSVETKSYLLTAFMKISAQTQTIPNIASVMVRECMKSHDTELVQQAMEFREMCKSGASVFLAAIPSKQENRLVVDKELHFLDTYVMQERLSGAKDYEERDLSDEEDEKDSGLKTEAYEAPEPAKPAAKPAEPQEKQPRRDSGFIDFSTVTGSFGFKPAAPASKPAAPTVADLFGGMQSTVESSQPEEDFLGSSEPANEPEPEPEPEAEPEAEAEPEPDPRALEAAALFGGLTSSKPAKARRNSKPIALQPANPLFAAPQSTGFFKPSTPASKPAPAPIDVPAQAPAPAPAAAPAQASAPADDLFSGMNQPQEEMFDMMDFKAPEAPALPVIDMTQCKLSAAYKIFTKDPAGELTVASQDDHVHTAYQLIYRVVARANRDV